MMKVKTIHDAKPEVHNDGCSGLIHLDDKYKDAEDHPDISKHRPISQFGDAYLAKFDSSEYFAWVKPVNGGFYKSCNPVFLIEI